MLETTTHAVEVRTYPDLDAMNPVERAAHRWDVPEHWAVCSCGWQGPMRRYLDAVHIAGRDAAAHAETAGRCVACEERPARDGSTWCQPCVDVERTAR